MVVDPDDPSLVYAASVDGTLYYLHNAWDLQDDGEDGDNVRQPPGIASSDAVAHVVWDDTRNGNQVTQTQDLYAASAQYEPLAATGIPEAAGYALDELLELFVEGEAVVDGQMAKVLVSSAGHANGSRAAHKRKSALAGVAGGPGGRRR
jgi:hypothetical protein